MSCKKGGRGVGVSFLSSVWTMRELGNSTMIEINPLAEVEGGDVLCMDAKFGFDDNADFMIKLRPYLAASTSEAAS
jgi:succinyl-CoA synthetase beta subunit